MAWVNNLLTATCIFFTVTALNLLDGGVVLDERNGPGSHIHSFERKVRATSTVDISTMPTCVKGACLSFFAPTLDCPAISAPCPLGVISESCSTYSLSCYCAQTTPLACAWICDWYDWLLAEDWFARPDICASAPNISFSGLPSCARNCIIQSSFDYGCITHTKNCFCSHGSLYGCDTKCKSTLDSGPGGTVASWYTQQCNVGMDTANAALNGSLMNVSRDPAWRKTKKHKWKWYEIMAITVGAATVVALLVMVGWEMSFKRLRQRKDQKLPSTKGH